MTSADAEAETAELPRHEAAAHPDAVDWFAAVFTLIGRGISRPFVFPAVGFACGCAAVGLREFPIWPGVGVTAVGVLALWLAGDKRIALAAALLAIGLGLGVARAAYLSDESTLTHVQLPRFSTLVGVVSTEPTDRQYSVAFVLDCSSGRVGIGPSTRMSDRVSVLVTGSGLYRARNLDEGEAVQADGVLDRIPATSSGSGFSEQSWMATQGVATQLRVRRSGGIVVLGTSASAWIPRMIAQMRRRSETIFADGLTPLDSAAASAIFLGDKSNLPPAVSSAFAATGAVHLLATAGLHIGILVMVLQFALRVLTVPRKWSAFIGIAGVWLYAGLAGDRPAVERAAFVASVYFAGLIFERIPDLPSALSLCALVLLWLDPREVLDPGFQLTFLTVIGIIAVMPALLDVFEGALSKLKTGLRDRAIARFIEVECLSAAAQASAAPLVAVYFNVVTIYGLAANLIAVPLMFLMMPCALLTLVAGAIWLPAGIALARFILTPTLRLVVGSVAAVAELPHCAIPVPSPGWCTVTGYYAALFGGSFVIQTLASRARRNGRAGDPSAADSPSGVMAGSSPPGP